MTELLTQRACDSDWCVCDNIVQLCKFNGNLEQLVALSLLLALFQLSQMFWLWTFGATVKPGLNSLLRM